MSKRVFWHARSGFEGDQPASQLQSTLLSLAAAINNLETKAGITAEEFSQANGEVFGGLGSLPRETRAFPNRAQGDSESGSVSILSSQPGAVGNVGPGEDTLKTYDLPANTLTATGDAVRIHCGGRTGIGGAKQGDIKVFFGSAFIGYVSASTTAAWSFVGVVSRTAAAAEAVDANTFDSTGADWVYDAPLTEDLTATVVVKVTGQNRTDVTNDVAQCRSFSVELLKAP